MELDQLGGDAGARADLGRQPLAGADDEEAARTLGRSPRQVFFQVTLPLILPGLLAGGALVFLTSLKELPATLILRPFDMDTLAVRVYQLAGDERLGEASGAALVILLAGLLPVAILSVMIGKSRAHRL